MRIIKAFWGFLLLAIRPLSEIESAFSWLDIINIIVAAMYPTLGIKIDWGNWFSGANIAWWAGLPALFMLIAGIKLKLRLIPRIQLVYDPQKYPRCKEVIFNRTIFRVGVKIDGQNSLDDVHVVLKEMHIIGESSSSPVLPQELNPSTHQPGTPNGKFTQHPGESPTFVNVAEWTPNEEIAVYYQENYKFKEPAQYMESRREIPNYWPIGRYRLVLEASGRNSPSVSETFYMAVIDKVFYFDNFHEKYNI